jgi:hypothetical protein
MEQINSLMDWISNGYCCRYRAAACSSSYLRSCRYST